MVLANGGYLLKDAHIMYARVRGTAILDLSGARLYRLRESRDIEVQFKPRDIPGFMVDVNGPYNSFDISGVGVSIGKLNPRRLAKGWLIQDMTADVRFMIQGDESSEIKVTGLHLTDRCRFGPVIAVEDVMPDVSLDEYDEGENWDRGPGGYAICTVGGMQYDVYFTEDVENSVTAGETYRVPIVAELCSGEHQVVALATPMLVNNR